MRCLIDTSAKQCGARLSNTINLRVHQTGGMPLRQCMYKATGFASTELTCAICAADFSPDYSDTWESLDRSIAAVLAAGKASNQAVEAVSAAAAQLIGMINNASGAR